MIGCVDPLAVWGRGGVGAGSRLNKIGAARPDCLLCASSAPRPARFVTILVTLVTFILFEFAHLWLQYLELCLVAFVVTTTDGTSRSRGLILARLDTAAHARWSYTI